MSNILSEVTGETIILSVLEELKNEIISVSDAFDKICQVFIFNLEYFSAKKNIHNAGQIAWLISAKLFPTYSLNPGLIKKLDKGERISFIEDDDFGKRITASGNYISFRQEDNFTPAITRGCAILLVAIRDKILDDKTQIVIRQLNEYIKSTGDLPKPEEIIE